MEIKNLSDIKDSIEWSVGFSFLIVFFFSLIILLAIHLRLQNKEHTLEIKEIKTAINVYESSFLEKLIILVNSERFLDYLHSGEKTRYEMKPYFLNQVHYLNESSLIGMRITDNKNKMIFELGRENNNPIILKLCHINGRLDANVGKCDFLWYIFLSKKKVIDELKKINHRIDYCHVCKSINLFDNKYLGSSFLIKDNQKFSLNIYLRKEYFNIIYLYASLLFSALIILTAWNKFFVKNLFNKYVAIPLEVITSSLKEKKNIQDNKFYVQEIKYLINQFEIWKIKEKTSALGELAIQVAHDIRSPLAQLNRIITRYIENIPEEQRLLIKSSLNNIQAIAEEMLEKYKKNEFHNKEVKLELKQDTLPIYFLLSVFLLNKKVEYEKNAISLLCEDLDKIINLCICIKETDFNRVLSNLINNAIEASPPASEIYLTISLEKNMIKIEIIDQGCGISPEKMDAILEGKSYGKVTGHGVGIPSCRKILQKNGGNLTLHSELHKGTSAIISLPRAPQPSWFISALYMTDECTAVIVDDDEFIHKIWEKKILNISSKINIIHYYDPAEFLEKYNDFSIKTTKILMDYHFRNHEKTGLEIIHETGLYLNTILVTGVPEDNNIRQASLNEGLKVIPKHYIDFLPIKLLVPTSDLILLDDNFNIGQVWKLEAASQNKHLSFFQTSAELLTSLHFYNKEVPIYIDSDLKETMKGEDMAKLIFDKRGYTNLFLATGYSKDYFGEIPWIKGIVGKNFPL